MKKTTCYTYFSITGEFDPDEITPETLAQPITRELAAKLLVNALFADQSIIRPALPFRDSSQISQSAKAIRTSVPE